MSHEMCPAWPTLDLFLEKDRDGRWRIRKCTQGFLFLSQWGELWSVTSKSKRHVHFCELRAERRVNPTLLVRKSVGLSSHKWKIGPDTFCLLCKATLSKVQAFRGYFQAMESKQGHGILVHVKNNKHNTQWGPKGSLCYRGGTTELSTSELCDNTDHPHQLGLGHISIDWGVSILLHSGFWLSPKISGEESNI